MSRKARKIERRLILPDHTYQNVYISKFINYLMVEGKKSIAEEIFYSAMDELVENRTREDKNLENAKEILSDVERKRSFVNSIFLEILNSIRPIARLKSKRIGGANYQVPVEITKETSIKIAMKSLIEVARKKSGKPIAKRLFAEFVNVLNKEGDAIKQKNEMEKRIESSKAFAHFV
jgi:small subunit ribosomal protein S7